MKLEFIEAPLGRLDYKVGDVVDFDGHIALGYARKYIDRGWAREYVAPAPKVEAPKTTPPKAAQPVLPKVDAIADKKDDDKK